MYLITSQEILDRFIPNVLASVKGEMSLFDKLAPAIELAEEWVAETFLGPTLLVSLANPHDTSVIKSFTCRIITAEAFKNSCPSLDLILTPNGFGIVNNSNVVPASRERVDKLIESLEMERDRAIHLLLSSLPSIPDWLNTAHCRRFASTMFPTLDVVDSLGINFPKWRKYTELRPIIEDIELMIETQYIGHEQMEVFRHEAMTKSSSSTLVSNIIRSLKACEVQLIKDKLSPDPALLPIPSTLTNIVNIIRLHPSEFLEWHNSTIASLYKPVIYENKKGDKAYWF